MKNAFEIRGDTTVIFLNRLNGIVEASIDTADLPIAQSFHGTWRAYHSTKRNKPTRYVNGHVSWAEAGTGSHETIWLHRLIMGDPPGKQIDHRDHDGWNNRRSNLRAVSQGENMRNFSGVHANRKVPAPRGVSWNKQKRKWLARVQIEKKCRFLGWFASQQLAGDAVQSFIQSTEAA